MTNKLLAQTQTYHINQSVDARAYDQYNAKVDWQHHTRQTAAVALANAILDKAGEMEIIDPRSPAQAEYLKAHPWEIDPFMRVQFRWTIRVVMPGELRDWFGEWEAKVKKQAELDGYVKAREELVALEGHLDNDLAALIIRAHLSTMDITLSKLRGDLAAMPGIDPELVG